MCDLAEKQRKTERRGEEKRLWDDGWIREGKFQSPFIFGKRVRFVFPMEKLEGEREKRETLKWRSE